MSKLQETIDKLNTAIDECRQATSEAHAATKDLRHAERDARALIDRLVDERVEALVNEAVEKGLAEYSGTLRKHTDLEHGKVIAEFDKLTSLLMRGTEANDALVAEVRRLRADNATLRDLLAKALPWVDPNESNDGHLLTVAITDALGDHRG